MRKDEGATMMDRPVNIAFRIAQPNDLAASFAGAKAAVDRERLAEMIATAQRSAAAAGDDAALAAFSAQVDHYNQLQRDLVLGLASARFDRSPAAGPRLHSKGN
jgi:hypothetical protein